MAKKAPVINVSDDFSKNLGSKIQQSRKDAKISRTEFAASLGVSRSSLIKWELGLRIPEGHVIALICRLLEIDSNALLGLNPVSEASRVKDRVGRLMAAEGETLFKAALHTQTSDLDEVLLGDSLAFSSPGIRAIASAYGVSHNWLITGAPEHWAPSLASGIPERLRFFRICLGIPASEGKRLRASLGEGGDPEVTMDGEPVIEIQSLLNALKAMEAAPPDFPFDVAWIATGNATTTGKSDGTVTFGQ